LTGNINIDLEEIAKSCNIFENGYNEDIIAKIDSLKSKYDENELVSIYNYMLSKSQNPDVLMHLIRCCDECRYTSTLEYLVDILLLKNVSGMDEELKEKFLNVRIMCAKAIGNQKNTSVVTSLLYCLNNKNENYRVRLACADALGRIGDRYAVAPLIEVIKDEDEKSVYLKEGATVALGLLGDSRALDPLVSIIEAKQGIMDKFSFLKERAIEALNKMGFGGDDRVFKALKSSLSDESSQVRIEAIEALMDSENPQAFDIIKNVLETDSDEEVKKNALIALYNMSGRSVLDEVLASSKYSEALKTAAFDIINEYESEDEYD
jgi:HEAT repeat protein